MKKVRLDKKKKKEEYDDFVGETVQIISEDKGLLPVIAIVIVYWIVALWFY